MPEHADNQRLTAQHVITPPRYSGHRCDLPDWRDLPMRSLARCPACGEWSYLDVMEGWSGGSVTWFAVHWWHFRLRRRIKTDSRGVRIPTPYGQESAATGEKEAAGLVAPPCPCACCIEDRNRRAHGREGGREESCACPGHAPAERCDCPLCVPSNRPAETGGQNDA